MSLICPCALAESSKSESQAPGYPLKPARRAVTPTRSVPSQTFDHINMSQQSNKETQIIRRVIAAVRVLVILADLPGVYAALAGLGDVSYGSPAEYQTHPPILPDVSIVLLASCLYTIRNAISGESYAPDSPEPILSLRQSEFSLQPVLDFGFGSLLLVIYLTATPNPTCNKAVIVALGLGPFFAGFVSHCSHSCYS